MLLKPTAPFAAGAAPVMRTRRAGIQLGHSEYPRRKCVPVRATQSKLGVCRQEGP